jgi:hypothetical protein
MTTGIGVFAVIVVAGFSATEPPAPPAPPLNGGEPDTPAEPPFTRRTSAVPGTPAPTFNVLDAVNLNTMYPEYVETVADGPGVAEIVTCSGVALTQVLSRRASYTEPTGQRP